MVQGAYVIKMGILVSATTKSRCCLEQ